MQEVTKFSVNNKNLRIFFHVKLSFQIAQCEQISTFVFILLMNLDFAELQSTLGWEYSTETSLLNKIVKERAL